MTSNQTSHYAHEHTGKMAKQCLPGQRVHSFSCEVGSALAIVQWHLQCDEDGFRKTGQVPGVEDNS